MERGTDFWFRASDRSQLVEGVRGQLGSLRPLRQQIDRSSGQGRCLCTASCRDAAPHGALARRGLLVGSCLRALASLRDAWLHVAAHRRYRSPTRLFDLRLSEPVLQCGTPRQ